MILEQFLKNKLIHPPDFLQDNLHFLADSGSIAYGTDTPESDIDLFGFCTPPKHIIFPHLAGVIKNFGDQGQNFERWSEQHIMFNGGEYDFCVLNIVNFFHLCFRNNPDQLDVLFVPRECIRHITSSGEIVRNKRHRFLSKQVYFRYKGYAYSQLNKAEREAPVGKRKVLRDKFGYDPKFLCHLYRLVYECEMMLNEGDLDLRRHKEHVKYVKAGNVKLDEAKVWFAEKEKNLDKLYAESKLPEKPDEGEIKQILLDALENHYGSLEKAIILPSREIDILRKIKELCKDFQ